MPPRTMFFPPIARSRSLRVTQELLRTANYRTRYGTRLISFEMISDRVVHVNGEPVQAGRDALYVRDLVRSVSRDGDVEWETPEECGWVRAIVINLHATLCNIRDAIDNYCDLPSELTMRYVWRHTPPALTPRAVPLSRITRGQIIPICDICNDVGQVHDMSVRSLACSHCGIIGPVLAALRGLLVSRCHQSVPPDFPDVLRLCSPCYGYIDSAAADTSSGNHVGSCSVAEGIRAAAAQQQVQGLVGRAFLLSPRTTPIAWHKEFPVGLEIEAERGHIRNLIAEPIIRRGWGLGRDNTLRGQESLEFRTPPMNGPEVDESLGEVLPIIRGAGYEGTSRAGLHVHVWAAPLTSREIVSFYGAVSVFENVIFAMMPPTRLGNNYAKPLRKTWQDSPKRTAGDINAILRILSGHYQHVSLGPYLEGRASHIGDADTSFHPTGQTIEFRAHSSTLTVMKAVNWARLCQGLVMNASEYRADPGEWDGQAVSPRKVQAFCEITGHSELYEYVASRILKFAERHGKARAKWLAAGYPGDYFVQLEDFPEAAKVAAANGETDEVGELASSVGEDPPSADSSGYTTSASSIGSETVVGGFRVR